ncbi:MAG: nucleotidyltransferase [Spirochaetia bacterium]|nr:nucleotidyltransferase [Spirochaetia bacterium]
MKEDIRWKQRFDNFQKVFLELEEAVLLSQKRSLSKLENQGLIQGFEYTHELAWNMIKDYLEEQGIFGLIGSKNTIREAFKLGILKEGEIWMNMIQSRNQTSHTYNTTLADQVVSDILHKYYYQFKEIIEEFKKRYDRE